jgi:hypothetical protein
VPYTGPFVRLTWQFQITGTDEIADTGVKLARFGGLIDADAFVTNITNAQLDNMAGYLATMLAVSPGTHWAAYSALTSVKVAACDANGHYTSAPKLRAITGHAGTYEDVAPQNTVVLSLRSSETFGRANYGRMYLPHTTYPLSTTYQATSAVATNVAIAGATMLGSINIQADLVQADVKVVNMSKLGTGTIKPVVRVGAGRLVDTQRRRRNALAEGTVFAFV